MRNEWNFWVVGGDLRQVKLAGLLAEDGHTVHTWALEGAEEAVAPAEGLEEARLADCVILPLPAAGEGGRLNAPLSARKPSLEEVVRALRPGQVVCAGRAGPELRALAEAQGLRLYDYFQREELAVANAVPTAEGAVQLAMEELPITLHGARVLDGERLADLKPGCLVIDLASRPGGVDLEAAARLGVRVIWALSLPGRVAPVTAGKILRDTIYHILDELGG